MNVESIVDCGVCGHQIRLSRELQLIEFPESDELLIEFYEGRLNVSECPVCKNRIYLDTPLIVTNIKRNSVLIVIPDEQRHTLEELLTEFADSLNIEYCADYRALYRAMSPWFSDEVLPVLKMIVTNKFYEQPIDTQMELLSLFVLRVFKSAVDGTLIEPILQFTGQASPAEHKRLAEGVYTVVITEFIRQLLQLSVKSREIPELNSLVRARLPSKCITDDVLSNVLDDCIGFKDPLSDATGFRKGFLRAYLSAIVHSHAGKENPQGDVWATYLFCVWKLSQAENIFLDPQFRLPSVAIRQTVAFRDLWDITTTVDNLDKSDDRMALFTDRLEMMKSFGFQAEFEETFITLPFRIDAPTDDPVAQQKIGDAIVSVMLKRYPFNIDPDKSIEVGAIVGGNVTMLLNNGHQDAAISVAREMLGRSLQAHDYFAAVATGARVIEALNNAEEFVLSAELMSQLMPLIEDTSTHTLLGTSRPALMLDFFNEMGNLLRHWHMYDLALATYSLAEDIYGLIPEQERDLNSISVLNRNRAIVYRGLGKYRKAKELFNAEIARRPDDPALLFNLVGLEIETNNFEQALLKLNQIIDMIAGKRPSRLWAEYLLCRAELKRSLGDTEAGLKDLIAAYHIASATKSNRMFRIAAVAMRFRSEQSEGREFIQNCLHVLLATLGDKERRSDPSLILTIVTLITERYLEEGTAVDFLSILQPAFEWLESWDMSFPWEYEYIRGWLAYQLGESKNAWSRLESAASKINERLPHGEDVSFSPAWMYDKDRFQQHLSSVAIDLVRRDELSTTELLKVYELTNGREIAARLGKHLSSEEIISGIVKLAEKVNRNIQIFFPLIEGKTIHLCHLSSTSRVPVIIEQGQWDRDELLKVRKQTYTALKQANPEDLSVLDARIRPWTELSAAIGKAMAPYLDESGHVCFLPGRDLTGLPLHLVQLSGGIHLLERTTVTYAPNFGMLLASQRPPSPGSVAVVTVSKRQDSDKFRRRALGISRELIDLWRRNYEVHELTELEATAGAISNVIQRVDHVIFICHGAHAGPGRGYGICVSDEHQLPPSLLPITEVPDLGRFVLSWDDFEEVDSCPHTVVSIACSSGLTEVVAGGTRHGLEQTLFGHGTRALISPLWDIDQEAGLEWLKTFCQARSQNPERAIEETYRETSLALKVRFSHPYFWGSFTLNGSLF